MNIEILKTLVGSQAHGLANAESDFDYRAVFVVPTSEFLKIGGNYKTTSWIEGKEDNTSWEIAHFLNMAVHCNPTILEVFLAPEIESNDFGKELRDLFPYVWNSHDVMNAFVGYGLNQRKKFLEDKDNRANKYAVAYLRTLFQASELLRTGTFPIQVADSDVGDQLIRWKAGDFTYGEVIQTCKQWEEIVNLAYQANPHKTTDLKKVNDFLIKVRKFYWE